MLRTLTDDSDLEEKGKEFLEWVREEEGNDLDIKEEEKEYLEQAAVAFGKSMPWLYSAGNGQMIGVAIVDSVVTSINWQGQSLCSKTGIPESLFKLKHAKKINLSSNDIAIPAHGVHNKYNIPRHFLVTHAEERESLIQIALVFKKKRQWLYNGTNEHNVCGWRGIRLEENGATIAAIDWAGEGLKGVVPSTLSFLKSLKSLDLRFNDISVSNHPVINKMVDATPPSDANVVRIQCLDHPTLYVRGGGEDDSTFTLGHFARLDERQWRFKLEENADGTFQIDDLVEPGVYLNYINGKLLRTHDTGSGSFLISSSFKLVEPIAKRPGGVSQTKEEGYVSIESCEVAGAFLRHRVIDDKTDDPRGLALTMTKISDIALNKEEVEADKRSAVWKLVRDTDDTSMYRGSVKTGKNMLLSGWKSGLVDNKIQTVLERCSVFRFDNDKQKSNIAACARSFGKNIDWLTNGKGLRIQEWRGLTLGATGEITAIDWSGENLSGKLPLELCSLKSLAKLDFSENDGIHERETEIVRDELKELRSRLGEKNCVYFTVKDRRTHLEQMFDQYSFETWQNRTPGQRMLTFAIPALLWLFVLAGSVKGGGGFSAVVFASGAVGAFVGVIVLLGHRKKWMTCVDWANRLPPGVPKRPKKKLKHHNTARAKMGKQVIVKGGGKNNANVQISIN